MCLNGKAFATGACECAIYARYNGKSKRAYVELRDADDDGGEMLASGIFSFQTCAPLTDRQIEQEIVRKVRHVLKRAATAIWATVHG